MRTIGVLLAVSMTAATGCLTLSTVDTSNTGGAIFTHNYGSAGSVVTPYGIAAGRLGQSWVTGTFSGTVNFGQGALSAPNSDMFLVGFSP